MKILGGDWPAGNKADIHKRTYWGKPDAFRLYRGPFAHDVVALAEIESADIVTQANQTSIAGKMGWGAVGAVALGPLGLLAGVIGGGNRSSTIIAVKFKDGRAVLLEGKSTEMQSVLGAAFKI